MIDVRVLLGVGEVARRCGVTIATVHFYEAKGLIHGQRNAGNQRRYSRDILRRIAFLLSFPVCPSVKLFQIILAKILFAAGRYSTGKYWPVQYSSSSDSFSFNRPEVFLK